MNELSHQLAEATRRASPDLRRRFTTKAFLDADSRHVQLVHYCGGERIVCMLPWPTWHADPDGCVAPSVHCSACGFHEHIRITGHARALGIEDTDG